MTTAVAGDGAALAAVLAGPPADALVTETCPECGELITGKPKGAGSVQWRMGTHRRNRHGIKGEGRKGRPKPGAPTDQDREARPVLSAIRDVASEIGGKGTPNVEQLGNGLGRLVGLSAMTAASFAVETDKGIPHEFKDSMVDYLSLSDTDARALMHPVARLLAPTKMNAKYGRAVIDNVDLVGAIAGLAQLGYHWKEYLAMRAQTNLLVARQIAQQEQDGTAPSHLSAVPDLQPAPVASINPFAPVTHASGLEHTPPGTEGRVLTADDVERMRAARG